MLTNACADKKNSLVVENKELHKTESKCTYDHENGIQVLKSFSLVYSKACYSLGRISCPTGEFGGCGNGIFDLRSPLPENWIKELVDKAEEIVCSYDYPEAFSGDSCCSICDGANYRADFKHLQQSTMRKYSNNSSLYCPSALEVCADKREHFQKHWSRGHPVVVHDVLGEVSKMCWDPVVMFYTYLEGNIAKHESNKELPPCVEFCDVSTLSYLDVGNSRNFLVYHIFFSVIEKKRPKLVGLQIDIGLYSGELQSNNTYCIISVF